MLQSRSKLRAQRWRLCLEGLELAKILVDAIVDKHGSDILLLDVQPKCIFADYFLLCNGENDRQLRAMLNSVLEEAKKTAETLPNGVEGEPEGGWVLVDFGAVIVHIFAPETRRYYQLEELWRDARVIIRMQ